MSNRKKDKRPISLLSWLAVQVVNNPQWCMTPERVVAAFKRSWLGRDATTGEARQALTSLVHEGKVARSRLGGRTWWHWKRQE